MYKINEVKNSIEKVEKMTFNQLGFKERAHLQEWIAKKPEALGEELLVIQKEFSSFDDTRERLDLLALDKEGRLVIIENKLDDSGRDVVWQALKYTSYCSSLKKDQIIAIYQQFLDHPNNNEKGQSAEARILDFLDGVSEIDEVEINVGNSQRIIFVAGDFRKEVTSTALWLLTQQIDIKCIKVTPYRYETDSFLNIEQVIPTPEAKEFMIGMQAKEAEERTVNAIASHRHSIRRHYWEQLLEHFRHDDVGLYENISPSKENWIDTPSSLSFCRYTLIFNTKELRVQFGMWLRNKEENKVIFDVLHDKKVEIEAAFGQPLEWLRNDNSLHSRVQISNPTDGFDESKWEKHVKWHRDQIVKLKKSIDPYLDFASQALQQHKSTSKIAASDYSTDIAKGLHD